MKKKQVSTPDRLMLDYIADVMERKLDDEDTEEKILDFLRQVRAYQQIESLD